MTEIAPEFSRLVPLARLSFTPFQQRIEATPQEREKLAQRFGLLALDRLTAVVELHRQSGGIILLEAAFEAEFVQSCVVTLDPLRGVVSNHFSLTYGPADDAGQEIEFSQDAAAFEPLTGEAIDIGEAVAQELSLALPEFPRDPDAAIDAEATERVGPFATLASLRKPTAA